ARGGTTHGKGAGEAGGNKLRTGFQNGGGGVLTTRRNCIFRPARDCRLVSGILRIVKGDKGTAGITIMVEPAGEFKPRTSAKVRFEFAMNIYTEPAASATETATDSTAPQAQSWRDTLPIHPAAGLFPRMSSDELMELGKVFAKTVSDPRSHYGNRLKA